MALDVSNSRDPNLQFINPDTEGSASPGWVVSSFECYILTTVATIDLTMADSISTTWVLGDFDGHVHQETAG